MSDSTFNGVDVNNLVSGFSKDPGADDNLVRNKIWVIRKGVKLQRVLDWGSRRALLGSEYRPTDTVRLEPSGLEFSLERFLELACWSPKTVFGWDNQRGKLVNTGAYKPILSWLGEGNLRLRRIKKPRWVRGAVETAVWVQSLKDWCKRTGTQFATTDGEGCTILERVRKAEPGKLAELVETDQFGSLLTKCGFEFTEADKLDKRAKPLTNLTGSCRRFDESQVNILVVTGVSDGAAEISPDLAELVVRSSGDHWTVSRGLKAKAFSGRVFCSMGLIKAVFVVNPQLKGLTIRTDARNIKRGVKSTKGVVVSLEPKGAKRFSRLHVQYWMTHQWLFGGERLQEQVFTEAFEVFQAIQTESLDLDLEDCMKALTSHCETREEASVFLQAKWGGFRWKHLGLKLKNSWGLTNFLFQSHLKFLVNFREGNLNPKVPCSIRCQLFNEAFARSAGLFDDPEPIGFDEVRVVGYEVGDDRYPCMIVSEERFKELAPVHGTCDEDDDFDGYFKTYQGRHVVVLLRTPCGPGEYTILNHHEGDFAPTTRSYHWDRKEDQIIPHVQKFPILEPTDGLPTRSGQAEIESQLGQSKPRVTRKYGVAWVCESAARAASSPGIGGLSNLLMCWASVFGGEGPDDQLAELSDVIDVAQAGGDERQAKLVETWLDQHWLELHRTVLEGVKRGIETVDPYLWNMRSRKSVKGVKLHRFTHEECLRSKWYKAMLYTNDVLKGFLGSRKDGIKGKLTEWLEGNYEPHGVFQVLADQESEANLKEGVKVLGEIRASMADIEARWETDAEDPSEDLKIKAEGRKADYLLLDPEIEALLLGDGQKLLIPVAVAIYRSQSRHHRDGMLFASEAIRNAFLDRVEAAMPTWAEAQEVTEADLAAARAAAAQFEF